MEEPRSLSLPGWVRLSPSWLNDHRSGGSDQLLVSGMPGSVLVVAGVVA
jgi:hypothetical protein